MIIVSISQLPTALIKQISTTFWTIEPQCYIGGSEMTAHFGKMCLTQIRLASSEKGQNSKFLVLVLVNAYHFSTIMKLKNHKLNQQSQGPSVWDW